jgi:hypothetical protein
LRANGSRECAPDDRLREAIHRAANVGQVAPRNDVTPIQIRLRPRDAKRPRRCLALPPKEGVGNAGCPLHPRPRVHFVVVERTRVTTSTPESPDVPARNGFNGFLRALPGDRALLPPSSADMFLSKPGWADANSANLTPASGRQDHTTSPYAATSLVRSLGDRSQAVKPALQSRRAQNAAASTASHPNVRDDHDTPLFSGRDGESSRSDLGCVGTEIFFGKSEIRLDRKITSALICPTG